MERYRAARRDPELVVLEGFHAVKHAIRFEALIIEMAAKSGGEINALAQQLAPDVRAQLAEADELPEAEFDMLAPLPHPTGLVVSDISFVSGAGSVAQWSALWACLGRILTHRWIHDRRPTDSRRR